MVLLQDNGHKWIEMIVNPLDGCKGEGQRAGLHAIDDPLLWALALVIVKQNPTVIQSLPYFGKPYCLAPWPDVSATWGLNLASCEIVGSNSVT